MRVGAGSRYDWARAGGTAHAVNTGSSSARRIILTRCIRRQRCACIGTNLLAGVLTGARRQRCPDHQVQGALAVSPAARSEEPGETELIIGRRNWQAVIRPGARLQKSL